MKLSFPHYYYVVAALIAMAVVLFVVAPDPATASGMLLLGNVIPAGELEMLKKAFGDIGLKLKEFTEKREESERELKARVLDLEQKGAHRPVGSGGGDGEVGALTKLVMESEGYSAIMKKTSNNAQIDVPVELFRKAKARAALTVEQKAVIVNATGQSQPLVVPQRLPGIFTPPERQLRMRDVLPSIPVSSNLIEFTRELVFSNAAGPQYDASSPTPGEDGALKNESGLTFELANAKVVTLAHWIPASRQVLSDAPLLQNHVENRMMYGLLFEEDDEILNGDGTADQLNGLINNSTAFAFGATNMTAFDAIGRAIGQLAAGEYTAPNCVVLSPVDWWSSRLRLAKNTLGEYILGDPQTVVRTDLFGLNVVLSNAMPAGRFIVMDTLRAGFIGDREAPSIRIAEQHADFFVRNLVVILVEERLVLVIVAPHAVIYGSLDNAG